MNNGRFLVHWLTAFLNERYADHYWAWCEASDRFWLAVTENLDDR